jgi:hypothetical protein
MKAIHTLLNIGPRLEYKKSPKMHKLSRLGSEEELSGAPFN